MNDVLLNEINPSLSEALPQDVNDEELDNVNNFIQSIFGVVARYNVKPIPKLVEFSEFNNYWHVKSGLAGNLSISFSFEGKKKYCLIFVV